MNISVFLCLMCNESLVDIFSPKTDFLNSLTLMSSEVFILDVSCL